MSIFQNITVFSLISKNAYIYIERERRSFFDLQAQRVFLTRGVFLLHNNNNIL